MDNWEHDYAAKLSGIRKYDLSTEKVKKKKKRNIKSKDKFSP